VRLIRAKRDIDQIFNSDKIYMVNYKICQSNIVLALTSIHNPIFINKQKFMRIYYLLGERILFIPTLNFNYYFENI